MKKYCAIDLETTDLIRKGKIPEIISWAYAYDENDCGASTDLDLLQEKLKDIYPVFHHANFDYRILEHYGFSLPVYYEDTILMSYVHNTNGEHKLRAWGNKLGIEKLKLDFKKKNYTEEQLLTYNKQDAIITIKLYEYFKELFDDNDWRIYQLELSLSYIIQEFERVGLPIDRNEALKFNDIINSEITDLKNQILKIIPEVPAKNCVVYKKEHPDKKEFFEKKDDDGNYHYRLIEEFNPNSPHHKIYALTNLYGWQPEEFTKTGKPKLSADVMVKIEHQYPLANLCHQINKKNKLSSTFLKPLIEDTDKNNFVHTSINQARTRTGRLSSSSPNLQNLPKKGESGDRIRKIIAVPNDKFRIVGCDLSNIEARVLAYYLLTIFDDYSIASSFIEGKDLHDTNARNWGLKRDIAKTVLYLTIYGGTSYTLANKAKIDIIQAKDIMRTFNYNCPNVEKLKDLVCKYASNTGYVKTILGRKIHYPELKAKDRRSYFRAKRQAFNAQIQGSAADIIKYLTVNSYPETKEHGALNLIQVHDEMLYLLLTENVNNFIKKVSPIWNKCKMLEPIPVVSEFKSGLTWYDVH